MIVGRVRARRRGGTFRWITVPVEVTSSEVVLHLPEEVEEASCFEVTYDPEDAWLFDAARGGVH